MFNHMIGNITKIRLRSYICASSDVFLPSISSLTEIVDTLESIVSALRELGYWLNLENKILMHLE